MRHEQARIAQLETQLAVTDELAVISKLKADKLAARLAQRGDDYRLRDDDIRELALAAHEIRNGDAFGLRRLEEYLDALEPRWRSWA